MFLIETRQKGPADVGGLTLPPPPTSAQATGTVAFARCWEYKDVAAFRSDSERHRILPGSLHDWDGQGKRFAWEVAHADRFVAPVPAFGHNMYGWQTRKTLEVAYVRFCDRFRHTKGVDVPVSAVAVQRMVRGRMRVILPTWSALADVPAPCPGDASEACFAELYILWSLSGMWLMTPVSLRCDMAERWNHEEANSAHGGRAAAHALHQRLLDEYWACPIEARQEILQDASALHHANCVGNEFTSYMENVACRAWDEGAFSLKGYHELHVVYADPLQQKTLICLAAVGSSSDRVRVACGALDGDIAPPEDEVWWQSHEEAWGGGAPKRNGELLEVLSHLAIRPRLLSLLQPAPRWHDADAYPRELLSSIV